MHRRQFLTAAGAAATVATAGCGQLVGTQSTRTPPLVENRPDAVYLPTHVEGMVMQGTVESGRYRFGLSYSFPHRFWLVTGDRRRQVEIGEEDSAHLMLSAWDAETETVIPTSNATVTIRQDGDEVAERSLWSMLSQNMGVHFGDNVSLSGDGTYEVDISFGPVETRRAGSLAGALGEQTSATGDLEFSQEELDGIDFELFEERQGERDAVDPMAMGDRPTGQVPPVGELPGESIGETTSGDATLAVTALSDVPDGVDGGGTYLAVSARTPYNRYPLPFMSLSARLTRDSEVVFEGDLTDTLHPDLGYHYGAVVEGIESGDTLDIAVAAPPQIARHEGYETAFLDMESTSLTV